MLQYHEELAQRLAGAKTFPDPNNNMGSIKTATPSDKYSLRPRSLRKCGASTLDTDATNENLEITTNVKSVALTTPVSKTRVTKPKQKPAPLSKYRRKTANARERSRMREINTAFEALRRAVPHMFVSQCPGALSQTPNEKLTKITTLRLAMRYITALNSALTNNNAMSSSNSSSASSTSSLSVDDRDLRLRQAAASPNSDLCLGPSHQDLLDLDTLLMESSDGESLCTLSDNSFPLSDPPLTPPVKFDVYFGEQSLSLDFNDQLSPDFSDNTLHISASYDPFLSTFS